MPDSSPPHKEFGRRNRPEIAPPRVVHKSSSEFPEVDLNQPLVRKSGLVLGVSLMGAVGLMGWSAFNQSNCSNPSSSNPATSNLQNCRTGGSHGGGAGMLLSRPSGFGGFGATGIGHGGGG
jgi:hypothetical protein